MSIKIDRKSAEQIRILRDTNASTIIEMAHEIGADVSTFFEGEGWSGLDLRPCDLTGVSFFGADMSGVIIYEDQFAQIASSEPRRIDSPEVHVRPDAERNDQSTTDMDGDHHRR